MAIDSRSPILIRVPAPLKEILITRAQKNQRSLCAELNVILERVLARSQKRAD